MTKSNKTNAAVSGFTFEGARAVVLADVRRAIQDEGQDVKAFGLDFTAGLIAKRLFSDLPRDKAIAKGKGIMGATSAGREAKAGQAVRTPDEETAWEAARKQWRRIGQEAGVLEARKANPKTKGDGKATRKTKGGKPSAAPKSPAKPKDAQSATLMLLNMAQSASAYCAKHKAVVSADASHAVADFLAAMAKLAK